MIRYEKTIRIVILSTFILLICGVLRLSSLAQRPMHTDEAVHAIKFGALLEENKYQYDPVEYHGPTLNYFTLIPAWLISARTLSDLSEPVLRIVPAFFGICLILILILLRGAMSLPVLGFAALFTAVSPAMVYYSRYYIQEMLLVFFTFGVIVCGYRYLKSRHPAWIVGTGILLGLMHATKETGIIALGAMLSALLLPALLSRIRKGKKRSTGFRLNPWHLVAGAGTALAVSALFYSSFLTHPRGILDSFLTFKNYFQKAGHHQWHSHPWYYYFKLLLGFHGGGGFFRNEAFILFLSGAGVYAAYKRPSDGPGNADFLRFLTRYALILMIIYCLIPYKTPWSMLGFYHGLILLAGAGAVFLFSAVKKRVRPVFIALVIGGTVHLLYLSWISGFRDAADPVNPYVYAHTSRDIHSLVNAVDEAARIHPDGNEMPVEVICPGHDYWPLPWYLRSYRRVGWYDRVSFKTPPAPLIIASPRLEPDLVRKLYELPPPGEKNLYLPFFRVPVEIRPGIEIRCYIIKDLWDRLSEKTP
jgi:uncharacterized protein (TIGR03663 family)